MMENAISEYQRWKQQGENLRTQAKQAMESRFRDLLTEAARIAQEYHADFGATLKPPPQITAFRFKAATGKGSKTAGTAKKTGKTVATPASPPSTDPKVVSLEKRLAQARAKLDAAKAAGKPTRNHEDRIYEIEDELRLANQLA
jgi:hypothetical protein